MFQVLTAAQAPAGDHQVYDGLKREIGVHAPRIDAVITVDGSLDEPAWSRAALLTGFSQYMPSDGRPAEDTTQVMVWYAPTAIYFGVRAFEAHGTVHATLANRDKIDTDDFVQLLLDTFYERRRALVFGINPLGVQADGVRAEGAVSAPGAQPGQVDFNPDFMFESKGRITAYGYEVEIRIPFKSLRYQAAKTQTWGIQISRKVQHSGYENAWTPVRRANASYLAQSGTLIDLTELQRGLVLDLNPFTTGRADGARTASNDWHYETTPEVGLNVRWGVSPNLTIDATGNPDFSQVEADVGQIAADPRFALFYPEKRPFFLEGIELFGNPNRLIYTRQIVAPRAGLKLTGKISGTNVGLISAVDDITASATGHHPVFNLVRLRRDVGRQSFVGLAYTDRMDGSNYNRVAAADARLIFGRLYYAELQAGGSATRTSGLTDVAPIWSATVDRTGRKWGFHHTFTAIDPGFVAASGFVSRTNMVSITSANRFTWYGKRGAALEGFTSRPQIEGTWTYHRFFDGNPPLEGKLTSTNTLTIRGGWNAEVKTALETYAFDPAAYARYGVERNLASGLDTAAFVVPGRLNGVYGVSVKLTTPQFSRFSGSVTLFPKRDVEFREAAAATNIAFNATLDWRPNPQIRVSPMYNHQHRNRSRDGTRLDDASIARLKLEYQVSRPVFLRFVGQYSSQHIDALRDPRTDQPILLRNSSGTYVRSVASTINDFRVDWLFSFQPNPGTVIFAGYGSSLTEPDAFEFNNLRRVRDGFFVKLSYLFRV